MITYNLEDNPNLFRIIDTIKRNFNIDLPIDYVIEHVGDCLRLIGKDAYSIKTESFEIKNNKVKLPCYADSVYEISIDCPYNVKGDTIYFTNTTDKKVDITYRIFQTDNNGFPMVNTEEEYYACYHWLIYQHLLSKFMMGIEDGNRLQYFENLKDRYINQARVSKFNVNKMDTYVKTLKSTKSKRKWK